MSGRERNYNKDRLSMLAGLVEEDDYLDVRRSITEDYERELIEDANEFENTLKEYMGYRPDDSEGNKVYDCECPEESKPDLPTEDGFPETAPGWSYWKADSTYSKMKSMKDDLQYHKVTQWYPALQSELEDTEEDEEEQSSKESNESVKNRIDKLISEYKFVDDENL